MANRSDHRVLGIDPGLKFTGYGCLQCASPDALPGEIIEAGVIRLKPGQSLEARLARLHDELTDLIQQLQPTVVAVEKLYAHYRHPRTAIIMGHARGVILLAAQQRDLEVIHLPSTEVKKAFIGHGHASKQQIQRAVQARFGLAQMPEPADLADAIAIAGCHMQRLIMRSVIAT